MASSAAEPYCRLYDCAREAIRRQQQQQGQVGQQESDPTTTTGRQQQHQHQNQRDLLEYKLDRMIEEAHQSSSSSSSSVSSSSRQAGQSGGTKRQGEDEQQETGDGALTAQQAGGTDHCDNETGAVEAEWEEGGLEDKCLGFFAEAFADDLDLLRKDEHFRGSAKNVAAMADMMRCLAGGLDSTEQRLLLENATR